MLSDHRDSAVTLEPARPLLEVDNLQVHFPTERGVVQAVRGVSFSIARGEPVAIVGESGSGKSVTAHAILGLVDRPGRIAGGEVRWKGESLIGGRSARRRAARIRGKEIAMVFQNPMNSLDPTFSVGFQLAEVTRHHLGLSRRAAKRRAIELLDLVGIPTPERRVRQHPHEFSGGMQQRVMIAMALACEPELLIADEPTTALDVTIQAQILELLGSLQDTLGLAVLLITHDLGVVAGLCDRVNVMYAGLIVESGTAEDVFRAPAHPYAGGLLAATPRLDRVQRRLTSLPGMPPSLLTPPPACAFKARCDRASTVCETERPPLAASQVGEPAGSGEHLVACWHPLPNLRELDVGCAK